MALVWEVLDYLRTDTMHSSYITINVLILAQTLGQFVRVVGKEERERETDGEEEEEEEGARGKGV